MNTKCRVCGSYNVQVKAWVYANTNQYISDAVDSEKDIWCDDCKSHNWLDLDDK